LLMLPVLLVLCIPILVLARNQSSTASKAIALLLALLLLLLKHWVLGDTGGIVSFLFYLPLMVVLVNMARSAAK
jgi:hypothetical protein